MSEVVRSDKWKNENGDYSALTQKTTGNLFISTGSVDTQPFFIAGGIEPDVNFDSDLGGGAFNIVGISSHGSGGFVDLGSMMFFNRSRGSQASPTALQNGDTIGGQVFGGYGAGDYQLTVTGMQAIATDDWDVNTGAMTLYWMMNATAVFGTTHLYTTTAYYPWTFNDVATFAVDPIIPDEAYGSGWNGVLEPPTKNAVYDKISSMDHWGTTTVLSGTDALTPNDTNIWSIDLIPSGRTFTGAGLDGTKGFINIDGAITINQASGLVPSGFHFGSTITAQQSLNGLGGGFLFRNYMTLKNANGVTANLAPVYTLAAQPFFQADAATITMGFGADFFSSPTFNRINSGTLTVGGFGIPYMQVAAWDFTVGAGVTIASRAGVYVANAAVTGTLTDNYGVLVAGQQGGTNGFGVVIGDALTNTLWVNNSNNSTDVAGGIVFGSSKDTNLYRSAADTLKTDDKLHVVGELELDGALNHDGANVGFFGTAPATQQTELTDELTSITHTAPGTPDYAIQDLTAGGFGFVTKDEGNTVLSVILNLQTRVNELETKLTAYGLLVDAD